MTPFSPISGGAPGPGTRGSSVTRWSGNRAARRARARPRLDADEPRRAPVVALRWDEFKRAYLHAWLIEPRGTSRRCIAVRGSTAGSLPGGSRSSTSGGRAGQLLTGDEEWDGDPVAALERGGVLAPDGRRAHAIQSNGGHILPRPVDAEDPPRRVHHQDDIESQRTHPKCTPRVCETSLALRFTRSTALVRLQSPSPWNSASSPSGQGEARPGAAARGGEPRIGEPRIGRSRAGAGRPRTGRSLGGRQPASPRRGGAGRGCNPCRRGTWRPAHQPAAAEPRSTR